MRALIVILTTVFTYTVSAFTTKTTTHALPAAHMLKVSKPRTKPPSVNYINSKEQNSLVVSLSGQEIIEACSTIFVAVHDRATRI